MPWLNALILFLLVAGHCELLAAAINRLHALRIHPHILRVFRKIQGVLMFGFPIVLVWFVGLNGPAVLRGGSWRDLPTGWAIYLGLCGAGTLSLAACVIRWWTRPRPEPLLANHSEIIDVAQRLGFRPTGRGKHERLLRVPGNECFQLEVAEKQFRLPRVPPEWDGLSIVHIADLHFEGAVDRPFFEEVCRIAGGMHGEMIVFTGDLLDVADRIDWLPSTLATLSAPLGCWFILGNHDWTRTPDQSRAALVAQGWTDLNSRTAVIEHRGRTMVLGGSEVPWMGTHPDFSNTPADAFRVLLSHTPDNIAWARRQRVDLMLSGHNHGGQVVLPILGPIYSPSRYGIRYAGGVFWEDPTLLYVSRGISAMQPLRINCRPELTKIVLRTPQIEARPDDV